MGNRFTMVLHRKSLRDLWLLKWQSLSIILMVACGVSLLAGFDMGLRSLFFTREKISSDLNAADLEVLFFPKDIETIPNFNDLEGIEKVEKRLIFPGTILLNNGKKLSGLYILLESPNPQINSLRVIEGSYCDSNNIFEATIERGLAKHHGFEPEDILQIKVGEKIYLNRVSGIVMSPEFLIGTSNPNFYAPGKGTLGVIFGNLARNQKTLGFTLVNDLLFLYSQHVEAAQLKKRILERMKGFDIEKVIQKEDRFTYKFMQLELDAFKIYIPAVILIMGALSFITTFVIYNRFINNQRKEIGTLLCLGYRRRQIFTSYLLGTIVLGIFGSALGLVVSLIVRTIFVYTQYLAMDLPVIYTRMYPVSLIKGGLLGIIITLIPPLFLLSRFLNLSPHHLIREPVKPPPVEGSLIIGISKKLSSLGLEFQYALRNIIRQKWLTLSTVACIGLSLGVAIAYLSGVTSINKTFLNKFKDERWHLCADFLYPIYIDELDEVRRISGVVQCEPYIRKFAEIGANNIYKESNLLGMNLKDAMKRVELIKEGQLTEETKRGVILNQDVAESIRVDVGDSVEVKVNQKRFCLDLIGICSEISVGQSIVPFSLAQQICELPNEATGAFIRTDHQADPNIIKYSLEQFEYMGRVTEKSKLLNEFLNLMNEFMRIVNIAIVFSIIVAVIFIYTNTNLIIYERKGEFALLKALGYGEKNIRKIIFIYIFIIGILGGLLSIPIAVFTTAFLNQRFSKAWYTIGNYFSLSDFIWIISIALALMSLMAIPAIKYIQDFEISEIIHQKSIE